MENPYLQLQIDPQQARWSAYPREGGGLALEGVRMGLAYRLGRARCQALARWAVEGISGPLEAPSPHGPLRQVSLALAPDENGLRCRLDFALPDERPLLLWRLTVHNDGPRPVQLERLTLLETSAMPRLADRASLAFFSNGWGSWNYSGAYGAGERFRRTRLGVFTAPMRVNAGTPQPCRPGHFASDMFAALGDRRTRRAVLAGFLSQSQHFGSLEAHLDRPEPLLRMWANGDGARLDPAASISTDWACLGFLEVDAPDPLGVYIEAVARQAGINDPQSLTPDQRSPVPSGWCSWYQFFQKVTAEDVRRNLQAAADLRPELPLDAIQIDDGFERRVGDWFSFRPGFPEGVAPLAAEIKAAGFTPGLWLAPFIVQRESRLAQEHPDWLLRGWFNRPVNAGFIWNRFTTALDLTHPEALDYARRVVHTAAHEWGFPYLKLDFLYAAALPGRYRDPTRTRAQVLRAGLEALRQAAGEQTFLLGCGCPLGPAIGLVQAMRIGADVAPRWRPAYLGTEFYFHAEPDIPSTRNAIQNTLARAALHRRWWLNDPDCLLLRDSARLTLAERQSLATVIALTGGMLLISDDLAQLSAERLHIAQALLPLIGQRPRILDWFDAATPARLRLDLENESGAWRLLALFNWADQPREMGLCLEDHQLDRGEYWAREFWSGRVWRFSGDELPLGCLPAHGVALLAVRRITAGQPQYLGSDLHLSQGLEVTAWSWEAAAGELRLRLERPGRARGLIDLALPNPPRRAVLDGAPLAWTSLNEGCYRFPIEFERCAALEIGLAL
ncbi:MAG: alpha-galactosidase [Anaerolineales bacterium]|nr:alpha-galactosidase [Anaerolineales bacterium]